MNLTILPFAQRLDLEDSFWGDELMAAWPAFMLEDSTANLVYADKRFERFLEFALVAFDEQNSDEVLARAVSVPFCLGEEFNRPELPDDGWDSVVRWADQDAFLERTPNTVSALEILVHPKVSNKGISGQMLAAMKANAARLGFKNLYAPVRPSHKHLEPNTPMTDYASRTREDRLPYDPWLRVHVRSGGRIVKIAPCSMAVIGTLDQWQLWTGLHFEQEGDMIVPGALVPVQVSLRHRRAVYIEPNVWVQHAL